MSGMGQFGSEPFTGWTAQYNNNMTNRKPGNALPQVKPKKTGFFGEDEEAGEPSMYFNNQTMFRPDKEMMTSQSPSQLPNFGGSLNYGQPSGVSTLANLQQRTSSNAPFARNNTGHITPTSISSTPNIPFSLQQQQQQQPAQQQVSPNRGMFQIGQAQRGIIRTNQISSSLLSPNRFSPNLMSMPPHPHATPISQPYSQRVFNHTSSASNAVAGLSGLASMNFGRGGAEGNMTNIDLSDFPSLGNRGGITPNPVPAARSYVGMVNKPSQDPAPEFQIQQEDFPALPGSQNPPTSNSSEVSRKTPTSQINSGGSYEAALSKMDGAKFPGDKSGTGQRKGIQTHQDGTVSNIPPGMVTDQFGMVGLLTFIRAAESDQNLVALAPGIDLTTLGLNLNSPENLYSTFQSPWADAPCRPQDIDFHVPSEYLTNIFIRDKLAPIKLNRYGDDLLFHLFYMNGGDVLQLAAAAELFNRDWRYHKDERIWITRAPGMEPAVKTNAYERGTYYFFDVQNWRKVAKEFHLEYDKLEERPHLPSSFHTNQQPVMAH